MKIQKENLKNNSIFYQLEKTVLGAIANAAQKVLDAWGNFIKEKEEMDRSSHIARQRKIGDETATMNHKVEALPK